MNCSSVVNGCIGGESNWSGSIPIPMSGQVRPAGGANMQRWQRRSESDIDLVGEGLAESGAVIPDGRCGSECWPRRYKQDEAGDASKMSGHAGQMESARTSNDVRPVGKATAAGLRKLIRWQQYRCAFTGEQLTPENCHADHRTPVSQGGSDDLENIVVVLAEVNRAKGALSEAEFISLCRRVVQWVGAE